MLSRKPPQSRATFMQLMLVIAFLCIVGLVVGESIENVKTSQHEQASNDDDKLPPITFAAWKKPPPPQNFALDAVFGDNMVLQQGPSRAAIYGFLGDKCKSVKVSVLNEETGAKDVFTNALINATHQPFGKDYGVRPCSKQDCPPDDMRAFNPWNRPLPTWKVLLWPMPAGGNYTVTAECTSRACADCKPATITNVTFGDVWYCSGQSNMWLPLSYSFSRNESNAKIRDGHYSNFRIMAGSSGNVPYGSDGTWNPGYGDKDGSNPWMTAQQAVASGRFEEFGATCWYYGQRLADLGITDIPIGLANTAIGGQRIEEYSSNSSLHSCTQRVGEDSQYWDAQLFATQVLPFIDTTVKGWIWYQGEANMIGVKGNSLDNVGYGCEMRQLVRGWRRIWSQVNGTTDPLAPFGIVTLASSGSAGGTNMGAMRHAQTANYGVVPNAALPNTFLAQAYDLDDEWGPAFGPCFSTWSCCDTKDSHYNPKICNATLALKCKNACAAAAGTTSQGAIHPRSKKQVGDRLGTAAFNTVYGGASAFTGPTLEGCNLQNNWLVIRFNATLLRGDELVLQKVPPTHKLPGRHAPIAGGSQLYVQTDANHFCMEAIPCQSDPTKQCCASWAGGSGNEVAVDSFDDGWIMLNFSLASKTSIKVDLSPLNGAVPTAVRYAWGVLDCCDYSDPELFVSHGCIASCPIMSSSKLPAYPFQARIVAGRCECVAPQICSSSLLQPPSLERYVDS